MISEEKSDGMLGSQNILTTYVKLGDTQAWAIQTISFFLSDPSHHFLLVCNYKKGTIESLYPTRTLVKFHGSY